MPSVSFGTGTEPLRPSFARRCVRDCGGLDTRSTMRIARCMPNRSRRHHGAIKSFDADHDVIITTGRRRDSEGDQGSEPHPVIECPRHGRKSKVIRMRRPLRRTGKALSVLAVGGFRNRKQIPGRRDMHEQNAALMARLEARRAAGLPTNHRSKSVAMRGKELECSPHRSVSCDGREMNPRGAMPDNVIGHRRSETERFRILVPRCIAAAAPAASPVSRNEMQE